MSNSKDKWIIGLGALLVIAICIGAILFFERKGDKKKIAELEEDKLKLILDSLKRNPNLSDEIKTQLEKLITEFEKIDDKISNELAQALQLFQIGQTENAIEDLVKIIEHLLKKHYEEDNNIHEWLKKQKQKFDLYNLLTFCRHEKKINDVEYKFFLAIKEIRNKEDNTLKIGRESWRARAENA